MTLSPTSDVPLPRPHRLSPRLLAPYLQPRPVAALLLGISSGFPLTLLLATMTFWLARVGIDKKTIGFAIGLTTPYTLKFLWAPLVDRIRLPLLTGWLGQRRGWLLLIQVALFAAVWMLGASDPAHHLGRFALWAIVTAFLSATQDIVIDAYRIEILTADELVYGTANNQFGYRIGNLIAGIGTVWLASAEGGGLGWALAYGLTGFCVVPAMVAAAWAGPGRHDAVGGATVPAGDAAPVRWLRDTVAGPFREFLARRGAWLILAFVLLYKIGDAMGQGMLNPMIVELGFSDTEFLAINKLVGFWGLIAGTALAAPFLAWLGIGRALFVSGMLMMVSNVAFVMLALAGHSVFWLTTAVAVEQVTSGIGLTVFITYLSGLSNIAYTATQFALLSSVAVVARTWLSTPAGYLAAALGWAGFWVMTMVAAVPGMVLLWILWRRGFVVDSLAQAAKPA